MTEAAKYTNNNCNVIYNNLYINTEITIPHFLFVIIAFQYNAHK